MENMHRPATDAGAASGQSRAKLPGGGAVAPYPMARQGGQGMPSVRLLEADAARRVGRKSDGDKAIIDADMVIYRLEEAGQTLLAMPASGWQTGMRCSRLDVVRSITESAAPDTARLRPPVPSAARVSRMDEALCWIALIPLAQASLRRIVGARALVSPVTSRHLFSWRRLGQTMGADHKAIQRWHAQAIAIIVAALQAQA